jgi:DNA-binding IclR family transcriptional regulator
MFKSARRVFEVFEYFAERRRPASVADVVQALGWPQSSTSVLLKALARLRYLEYDRHKRRYLPTMRVALLGSWIHDQVYSQTSLARLVDELHERSGATVIIGMQNDTHVQYIHMVQAPAHARHWYIKRGSLRPLCRSAVGKVLLSRKSDLEAVYLLRRINAEEPEPRHRVGESDLLRELDLIRRQGFARTEGAVNPQAGVVAVRLPTPPSQPDMAIGIGSDNAEMTRRWSEFLRVLREALEPYDQADPYPRLPGPD